MQCFVIEITDNLLKKNKKKTDICIFEPELIKDNDSEDYFGCEMRMACYTLSAKKLRV